MALQLMEDPEGPAEDVAGDEPEQHPALLLQSFIGHDNLVPMLDGETVKKIGMEVTRGYDIDKTSRADWEKQSQSAMDLAMQVATEKSWPWPKAANVKYPLITTAAIQFSARAYPAIVRGADVVKGEVIGPDPQGLKRQRADRIGRHMSYQVLEEIPDWDEDMDKLLMQMSIVGCAFRKTYFDTMSGLNCSDLVPAKYVVYNHKTPFNRLRRITHELFPFKNEIIEKQRGGIWSECQLGLPAGEDSDEDGAFEFLEQHCWYDVDGDGYKEPYTATVKKDSSEVVRIVARFDEEGILLNGKGEISKIEPVEYWTKYAFMPNPDGGSYDVGLGLLLNPINETVNSVLNQLLDAGTRDNTGGGFIGSGLKMKGGPVRFAPGEYKPIDNTGGKIADNIYHLQSKGPSPVLFELLGMLIEAGKDISSVKDILTGDQQINQTATTTLALIEQGQKVFSAIYKRVHRALKQEFKKLYRLNRLYLQPEDYYRFNDKQEPIFLEDYQGDDTDVAPVSDPTLVSDAQELTRAEALMKFVGDPFINQPLLREKYLKALKEQEIEELLDTSKNPPPPIDPKQVEQMQQQAQQAQQQAQQQIEQMQQALQSAGEQVDQLTAEIQSKDMEIQFKDAQIQGADGETQAKIAQQDNEALLKSEQDQRDAETARYQAEIDAQTELEKAAMANEAALKKAAMDVVGKIQIAALQPKPEGKDGEAAKPEPMLDVPPVADNSALMAEALARISDAIEMMSKPRETKIHAVKQADGSFIGTRTEQ